MRRDIKIHIRRLAASFMALLFVLSLSACKEQAQSAVKIDAEYGVPYELTSARIGTSTGSAGEEMLESVFAGVKYQSFNDSLNMMIALADGKLDLGVTSRTEVDTFNRVNSIYAYSEGVEPLDYHFMVKRGNGAIKDSVNEVLRRFKEDGTLAEIVSHWQKPESEPYVILDVPELDADAPVLKIAISGMLEPMFFIDDDKEMGLNVELGKRIAYELGMRAVFQEVPMPTLIALIESDKCDLAMTDMLYTSERAAVVELSDAYYSDELVFVWTTKNMAEVALPKYSSLSQLEGRSVAVLSGATTDSWVDAKLDAVEMVYCSDLTAQLQMLMSAHADAVALDAPVAKQVSFMMSDVCVMPGRLNECDYGFMLRNNSPLTDKINAALDELWADGTVAALTQKWIDKDSSNAFVEDVPLTGENGVLRFAFESTLIPMCYLKDGTPQGFEVELMVRVAEKLGMKLEYAAMNFSLLLPRLTANRADVAAGCFSLLDERASKYDMTQSTCHGGTVLLVNNYVHTQSPGFFESIATSFENTFLSESRWKQILNGLLMTVMLSLTSSALGTVLGFLVCLMLRSGRKRVRAFASGYVQLLESTPLLVLLMILYYIVFKNADIEASIVAILAFSLNFSAFVAELMDEGIASVSRGQREAALSLGLTRKQAFVKIVFPQAVRHSLEAYKRQFISLVEMTSIVGYVAIHDLTKVSDMIRSRTFEAFLPLISTAVIYFVIARVLTKILKVVELKIEPKHRKVKLT